MHDDAKETVQGLRMRDENIALSQCRMFNPI